MRVVDCNTSFGIGDVSPAALLGELEQHRIAQAWTYSRRGLHLADEGNAETLAVAARHPVLTPVATIDPHQPHGLESEIARCLRAGMRLFRLFPLAHRWRLDSQPFLNMLEHLRGSGAVLLLPVEEWGEASTIARLTADAQLPVVLMGVHYTQLAECCAVMRRWPHLHAGTSRLATPDDVERLVREVGADRLLFGSEAPERPVQCALNHIWYADIADADRAAIFGGNAARLLDGHTDSSVADSAPPRATGLLDAQAGPSAAGAPEPDAAPPVRSPVPIVDVHAHLGRVFLMAEGSVEALMANRAKYNIQTMIVSSIDAIAYDLEAGNRQTREAIGTHAWLYGYVVADPNYLAASAAELARYAGETKFVGVKIHGEYSRTPTASPRMHALFAEIARHGKPVKIHNAGEGWDHALVAYAREFPQLRIIIAHAGPGAPSPEAIDAATRADNIYLEFCSTYPTRGLIREAITRAGVEKILFGSDQLLIDPAYVLGAYQDARLTDYEWEQIAWRNACWLFGLPMPQ